MEYQAEKALKRPTKTAPQFTVYEIGSESFVYCPVRNRAYKVNGKPEEVASAGRASQRVTTHAASASGSIACATTSRTFTRGIFLAPEDIGAEQPESRLSPKQRPEMRC
jgi:hypothetical protein